MAKKQYTAEQLVERWEHYQEIVNLMGRRSFLNLWKMEDTVWDELWCKMAPDPCMGCNNGYYKGYDAIGDYFISLHKLNKIRAEVCKEVFPQELEGKSDDELYGVGSCNTDNLTTPLVEIAEDNQTAKGIWYSLMNETDYTDAGPTTYHKWGWVAVDFVYEDGKWKIWHLLQTEDFKVLAGKSWAAPLQDKPADTKFAKIGEYKLPEPNVPGEVFKHYSPTKEVKPFAPAPVAYDTFTNTFSYGV